MRVRLASLAAVALGCAACAFDKGSPDSAGLPLFEGVPEKNLSAAAVARFDPAVDYFPEKAEFRHTTQISVSYHGHYKVLRVVTNGMGQEFRYVLVQRGTPVPGDVSRDALVVPVPVLRFSLGTYRYGAASDILGVVDRIVGFGNHNHATVPSILARFESGELSRSFDLEAIMNRRSEAHFNWHYHAALTRLNESFSLMGVPLVEMAEHLEPTPLARSEWIKFFALFFNQEAEAESAFGEMEVRYNALRARVAAVAERPRVLVGAPEDDGWRMYGGRNVHTRMIEDAGGRYLWEDDVETDSGRYTHFEDALARAREAELWIVGPNTSFGSRIFETTVLDPRYDYIPAVRNGRVWVANINWPTGPNPWWDYSLISPHFELADHVRMIHPGLLPPGDMTFYRSLAGLQVTDASSR